MDPCTDLKTAQSNVGDTNGDKAISSEALVAELLSDIAKAGKPLRIQDEIAGIDPNSKKDVEDEDNKSRKHKKHKKEKKKKKKHHRERSRSRERKRKRSRSKSRKSKKSKKDQRKSSSKTYSFSSCDVNKPITGKSSPEDPDKCVPVAGSFVSDDDDLPVGADYRTVLKEAKMSFNIDNSTPSFNLDSLPSNPGCSVPKQLIEVFPLSKEVRMKDESGNKCDKIESEVLNQVIAAKGKADFVPRNVKLKASNGVASPKPIAKADVDLQLQPVHEIEPIVLPNAEEANSDAELEKKIELELKQDKLVAPDDRWTRIIEDSVKKIENAKAANERHRSTDATADSSRRSKKGKKRRSRSRSRSRSRDRSRRKSRSHSPTRSHKGASRKRSRSGGRYRSRTPDKRRRSRSHSRGRRSRSRSLSRRRRSRSRSYNRRRFYPREHMGIDKDKLREIAERKAKSARQLGLLDPTKSTETVEDFITYCEKLQKRQEKEYRREKGETVSSDDDDSDHEPRRPFQHPYGIKPSEPIKINIVNATQLPTKTPQECIIDSTQLRVVFPVSSGVIHKESSEWKRVEPAVDKPPVTCLATQKNNRAMSSLQVEQARNSGKPMLVPTISMLPFPPTPPCFPNGPSRNTAFDLLLPPPPPLPPTLFVPSESEMIMSEPMMIEKAAPKDVSRVLASRARAQTALAKDPNDYDARRDLKEANDQMAAWAAARQAPGKFTGSTGLHVLSAEELQPRDPRFNSWVKKDMFKTAKPAVSQVGMRMMMNMGWRPGRGLGRDGTGDVEPLTLDVKSDRKGLQTLEDLPARMSAAQYRNAQPTDVLGKNPVSLVMELCSKRRWGNPLFTCHEYGMPNNREFLWSAVINGVTYQPAMSSRVKKDGKAVVCQVILQALRVLPRDPNLPVRI